MRVKMNGTGMCLTLKKFHNVHTAWFIAHNNNSTEKDEKKYHKGCLLLKIMSRSIKFVLHLFSYPPSVAPSGLIQIYNENAIRRKESHFSIRQKRPEGTKRHLLIFLFAKKEPFSPTNSVALSPPSFATWSAFLQ